MIDLNFISPYIRVAMDSLIKTPWRLSERVIFDYELLYIKEGQVRITIGDKLYIANPGDIFLFKPRQRHSIELDGCTRFRQPHIHFDLFYKTDSPKVKVSFKPLDNIPESELKYFREDITRYTNMVLPNKLTVRDMKYFEKLLFDIIDEYKAKMPFYEISVKGLFTRLWAYILRENNFSSNQILYTRIGELEAVKEYLDSNLDRELSLSELSSRFNISKYHLARLFSNVFGTSPIHYHRAVRIEKAKEMIQFSDASITEISEKMGFSSINSFSRIFRKVEGVPPTFYRTRVCKQVLKNF